MVKQQLFVYQDESKGYCLSDTLSTALTPLLVTSSTAKLAQFMQHLAKTDSSYTNEEYGLVCRFGSSVILGSQVVTTTFMSFDEIISYMQLMDAVCVIASADTDGDDEHDEYDEYGEVDTVLDDNQWADSFLDFEPLPSCFSLSAAETGCIIDALSVLSADNDALTDVEQTFIDVLISKLSAA